MNLSNRCLEEGAEEFFLKPVRQSDLVRLQSHIKKTKLTNQNHDESEKLENTEVQQHHHHHSQQIQIEQQQAPKFQYLQPESEPTTIDQQQQPPQQANNNKRKTMEQGVTPETDRTRPRYSGIATVV